MTLYAKYEFMDSLAAQAVRLDSRPRERPYEIVRLRDLGISLMASGGVSGTSAMVMVVEIITRWLRLFRLRVVAVVSWC